MKNLTLVGLALAASMVAGQTASAAPANSNPIAANAFIIFNGIDWAWASPCNGGCSTITLSQGFRYATADEWAARPQASDFLDPSGNYNDGSRTFRCASQYFDNSFTHCDYSDAASGVYLSSGPDNGYPYGSSAETWLVRDEVVATPEPASVALLATGLVGLVGVARRRKA